MSLSDFFAADLFTTASVVVFLQIVFIDLVLAGDNAIIVGMVAARVHPDIRKKVIYFGVGAAVIMRIGFSLLAVRIINVPGLMLLGGLMLFWVCWHLYKDLRTDYQNANAEDSTTAKPLNTWRTAVVQIVIADLSMSIDNILAIAGVARDHPTLLVFGLALSVAFMIFAATLIAKLLTRYSWIAYIGLALILYVAIIMTTDGAHDLLTRFA